MSNAAVLNPGGSGGSPNHPSHTTFGGPDNQHPEYLRGYEEARLRYEGDHILFAYSIHNALGEWAPEMVTDEALVSAITFLLQEAFPPGEK